MAMFGFFFLYYVHLYNNALFKKKYSFLSYKQIYCSKKCNFQELLFLDKR